MMCILKFLILSLFLMSTVLSTSLAYAELDMGSLKKGVVKVATQFSTARKIGTGFIAAQGKTHVFIVTASHVVEGESEVPQGIHVTFYTHQEETFPAKVVKKEGGDPRGLALLKVRGDFPDDIEVLPWDVTTQVGGGEEIHLVGFPRLAGSAWAVTRGTLSGFDGPVLKFSGAVAEGNSGGPVLYHGKVIGVVMEVTGQFGNAKPAQIAKFTVENWPGFPLPSRHMGQSQDSGRSTPITSFPSDPHQLRMGTLVIETTPQDAQVFVDDELMGNTFDGQMIVGDLEPDEYDVMITKNGFLTWERTIDLQSGEKKTIRARLQEGQDLSVTGVWRNPSQPTISYVFQQQGRQVTMSEMTTNLLGTAITAQGEGQLQGNQLEITYQTALGTMGRSIATLSDDGTQLIGTYQDFSNMIPVALALVRTGDLPAAFSATGSTDFNTIQNFGE